MKIAVLSDQFPPQFGGMASHAYYISRYLGSKNHEVIVITHKNFTKEFLH